MKTKVLAVRADEKVMEMIEKTRDELMEIIPGKNITNGDAVRHLIYKGYEKIFLEEEK